MLHLLAQFDGKAIDFNAFEKFLDRFRAHHGLEAGGAELLIEFTVLGFVLDDFAFFGRGVAWVDDYISLEIQDRFQVAQGNVEQMADAAGQSLEDHTCEQGDASSMWPRRSRRTFDSVTSTPHLSQITPRCFMRLYLPQRHSQSVTGPKMRAQNKPSRSGLKVR